MRPDRSLLVTEKRIRGLATSLTRAAALLLDAAHMNVFGDPRDQLAWVAISEIDAILSDV
jgi:hypothetical protein